MKCIVCDKSNWRTLFSAKDRMFGLPGHFAEKRCGSCGLVRLDPRPKNLAQYYPPRQYYSYTGARPSFFGLLRAFLISHRMFGFVPAMPRGGPGKILDVGCGTGDTLELLQTVGWDVYGMDIDNNAIEIAKKRGLSDVRVGNDRDIADYPNGFFDVIRLYHVIEHLPNPGVFLALARKKLKPGGEIILGTPNIGSLVARCFQSNWYNLDAPRHLYLFTPSTLAALVHRAGYTVDKVQFASAGGWVGSLQYRFGLDLINRQWLVMLVYPFEWILDRLRLGDVFVLRARSYV